MISCTKQFQITVDPAPPPSPCPPPAGSRWFYWTMQETSPADRVDSIAGLHMAEGYGAAGTMGITTAAGLYGNALSLTNTGTFSGVSLAASSKLQLVHDGQGFSFCGWWKLDSWPVLGPARSITIEYYTDIGLTVAAVIFGTTNVGFPQYNIFLTHQGSNNTIPLPQFTAGVWHFFHLFWDGVLNKYGFEIDGGGITYASFTPAAPICPSTGTVLIEMSGNDGLNCLVDEITVRCDRKFTAAEVAYLYNGGAGRTWPIVFP